MGAVGLKDFTGVLAFVTAISCVVVLSTMLSFQWTIKPTQPGNVESRSAPAENSADLRGHVFVIEYGDQLSQAVKNFFQISHIAARWNLKVVEPFFKSRISGLVGTPHDSQSLSFFDIYSMTAVHKEMEECFRIGELEVMESFQDFLVNASRQFVVVQFLKTEIQEEAKYLNIPAVSQCSISLQPVELQLNQYLDQNIVLKDKARMVHGGRYKFKGIQAICVNGWNFSLEGVHAHILSTVRSLRHTQRGAISVVIPKWRRITNRYPVPFYYTDTSFSWEMCNTELLPFGDRIVDATEAFMFALNIPRPTLGIHIRIEKLVTSELWQNFSGSYERMCLSTFEAVVRALQRKYNLKAYNIVAMHDLGKFGTDRCHGPQCNRIKAKVLETLNKLGVRVVYYDPARFNEINDLNFISQVDMAFLTRADYLLTLGWGGYHKKLIRLFQATHSDSVSFNVCFSGRKYTDHHLPELDMKSL